MNETFVKMKTAAMKWADSLKKDKGMALSLLYVFLPIFLFFFGWLRFPLALLLCGVFLCFLGQLGQDLCVGRPRAGFRAAPEYWLALAVVVFIWVLFSGIGGFTFQNSDFFVRNPVYRDLIERPWPVMFDLSEQREYVQSIVGSDRVAFSYYFCFWLPPALLSKLFAGKELVSGLFLVAWAYLGVMLVLYQLHRYLGRTSWAIPGIFIFFGGLDAIGYRLLEGEISFGEHLEWWCSYFQYSSHTTVLYWVFNQAIPVWLVCGLLLNIRGNRSCPGLSALIFAYSPFATIGMVPLAVYSIFRKGQKWKRAVNWGNILVPLLMLIVFGSFYLSNPDNVSERGWIFGFFYPVGHVVVRYLLFIFLEVGIYALILRKCILKYDYLWPALAELALIPMYRMTGANDFAMRASLPGLFILSVCVMRYVLDCTVTDRSAWAGTVMSKSQLFRACGTFTAKWEKWAIVLILTVAAVAPLSELYRSVSSTVMGRAEPYELVHSFGDFATDDENVIRICRQQFFTYYPEETFFFRYLGKM